MAAPRLRAAPAEKVLEGIASRLAPAGITRLADVTHLDVLGIPTWQAIRPLAITLAVSQGKGTTHVAAKLAAAMEGIEHATWERFESDPHWNSRAELERRARVVSPAVLADALADAFDDAAVIPWCRAAIIPTGEVCWVPHDTVCVLRGGGHRKGPRVSFATTNGLAAGSTAAEATLHALLEVIERDAHACADHLLEFDATPRPRIDLSSATSPALCEMLDRVDTAGIDAVAFWNPNELGVPTCSAYLIDDSITSLSNVGHGAHLDPEEAILRAFVEAAQGRITMISGSREDNYRADYRCLWEVGATIAARARHEANMAVPVPPPSWETAPGVTAAEEALHLLLERIERQGFAAPVRVDMTASDIAVPVVKVIAPGLAGYHRPLMARFDRYRAWLAGNSGTGGS